MGDLEKWNRFAKSAEDIGATWEDHCIITGSFQSLCNRTSSVFSHSTRDVIKTAAAHKSTRLLQELSETK